MRYSPVVLLVSTLFGASLLPAQFQPPSQQELQMTSDPKAPGASAVYLYIEEKTDDSVHNHSYYARVKVLTEKGKELATVRIPYEHSQVSVAGVFARTIHADGSIVQMNVKPSDLMVYKSGGHQYNDVTFTLPAVEVGSVLEYGWQIRYSDNRVSSPEWDIQQRYFVHRAHYFFNPVYNSGEQVDDGHGGVTGGLMYSQRIRSGQLVQVDSKHQYTLDVSDVDPMPTGDYLPPLNGRRDRVIFYYTSASTGPQFWEAEGRYWAKNTEKFASTSGPIKKAAADLVTASDSDDAKARKVYAAVQKIENTDFVLSTAAHDKGNKDAASVWKQQRGSSDQIALTYVALARAAGLKAWPMLVVNRNRAVFDDTNLSMGQFDDYIVVVEIGGKEVYLDPGQKMCPFGVMHWKHESTRGMRLSEKGVTVEDTPAGPAKAAGVERIADLTIDDKGAVTGTGRVVLSGLEAMYWRQLSLVEEKSELAKDFSDSMAETLPSSVKVELDGFVGLGDYESNLTAPIKISGDLGASTAKRMIFPGFLFQARAKQRFEDEKRELPVDLHYATLEQDDITYHFPAGMKVGSLPRNEDFAWASVVGVTVAVKQSGNSVTVKRTFARNNAVMPETYYENLRYVYQRMATTDQQPIVLERAAEGAPAE
jgi:transglutaminase-like putative cysteine protease